MKIIPSLTRIRSVGQAPYAATNIVGVGAGASLPLDRQAWAVKVFLQRGGIINSFKISILITFANITIAGAIYSDNGTGTFPVNIITLTNSNTIVPGFVGDLIFRPLTVRYVQPLSWVWLTVMVPVNGAFGNVNAFPGPPPIGIFSPQQATFTFPDPYPVFQNHTSFFVTVQVNVAGGVVLDHYPGIPELMP